MLRNHSQYLSGFTVDGDIDEATTFPRLRDILATATKNWAVYNFDIDFVGMYPNRYNNQYFNNMFEFFVSNVVDNNFSFHENVVYYVDNLYDFVNSVIEQLEALYSLCIHQFHQRREERISRINNGFLGDTVDSDTDSVSDSDLEESDEALDNYEHIFSLRIVNSGELPIQLIGEPQNDELNVVHQNEEQPNIDYQNEEPEPAANHQNMTIVGKCPICFRIDNINILHIIPGLPHENNHAFCVECTTLSIQDDRLKCPICRFVIF